MHDPYQDSIFVRILISLWSRRRLIGGLFLATLAVAVAVAWLMPKVYTTGATIQIKTKEKSSLPSQLTKGLKMLDPLSGGDNAGVSTVLAIFESRQLAVDMIEKFRLMEKYKTKWLHFAIRKFQKNLGVSTYAEGIIQVEFSYPHQDSVKIIADSILAYVDAKNQELATSKARIEYAFLKAQADQIDKDLGAVADSMIHLLRKYNMADFKSQMEMGLDQLARLDQEITSLTSEERLLETDNSGTPLRIRQVKNLISLLEGKQKRLLQGKPVSLGGAKFAFTAPYDTIPILAKEFKFLETEVKKNEGYLTMLLPKLQETRIAMVENTPTLTFIDPTFRPVYKSKPKRILVIILIVFPVMMVTVLALVIFDILRHPDYAGDPGRTLMRHVKSKAG